MNENNEIVKKKKKAYKLKKIDQEGKILEILFKKIEDLQSLTAVETYLLNNDIRTKNGKRFTRFTLYSIYTNIVYAKNDIDMYNYLKEKEIEIYANKNEFDGKKGMIAYNKTKQQKHKANIKNEMKDWIVSVGKHEGYLTGKRWINIQNILEKNKNKRYRKPRKNKALLSGILKCECNGYMRPKLQSGRTDSHGEDRFFYMCETKELSRKHKCSVKNIDGNELDRELLKQIKAWGAPNYKVVKELKEISEKQKEETEEDIELDRLKRLYTKNKKDLENLIDRIKYVDVELIDDINREIKKIKEENKNINEKVNKLINNTKKYDFDIPESEVAKLVIEVIENFFDIFTKMDIIKQRNLLKMFITSAVWDGETVQIDLLDTKE